MLRRWLVSTLLALALAVAGGHQVAQAARPLYLVCRVPNDALDFFILVDNFGGVGGAVKQCVQFWRGYPNGFTTF